jgi:hypothetical protein
MFASGPQMGRLVWVKPTYPQPLSRQPQPDPAALEPSTPETAAVPSTDILAERRAKHLNRRIARMSELTRELLQACDGKALPLQVLVALARVFGTNQSRKGVWHYGPASDPWEDFDAFRGLSPEEAAAEIWTDQLQPVLASRLQYCGPDDAWRLHREILSALKLLGADYADLYRTVARALPEPKAWTKLPGYQPEDLDGEPPVPAPAKVLPFDPQEDPFLDGDAELEAISA